MCINSQNKNKIILVDPFYTSYFKNSASIACLRGYLKKNNFSSEVINYNKLLSSKIKFNFRRQLIRLLEREFFLTSLDNNLKSLLSADYIDLHSFIYRWGPKKIWEIVNKIKTFDDIFKSSLKNYKKKDIYIGISVSLNTHLLFSLILANYIKKNINKNIKIIFGGTLITLHYEEIIETLKMNPVVDFVVEGDGERPLYEIISGKDVKTIPNLTYYDKRKYSKKNKKYYCEDIDSIPRPVYEKDDIIYIQATRKCYWNKCSFCMFSKYDLCHTTRHKNVDQLIYSLPKKNKDILDIYFTDSCLSPVFLKEFSEKIIAKGMSKKYRFLVFMRCDNELDYAILELAKKAGFHRIMFGVETISPRLLSLINKGTKKESIVRIISDCNKLNLSISLLFMANLPTQTKEELIKDLDFIKHSLRRYSNIKHIEINKFHVRPGSDIYENPSKYHIKLKKIKNIFMAKMVPYTCLDPKALLHAEAYSLFWSYYKEYFKGNKKIKIWFPFSS